MTQPVDRAGLAEALLASSEVLAESSALVQRAQKVRRAGGNEGPEDVDARLGEQARLISAQSAALADTAKELQDG